MSQTDVPTALILSRIVFAHAVMSYAPQLGVRIPQDLSIISIADSFSAQWLVPGLARYKVQPELITGKLFRLAYKLLTEGPVGHDRITVDPEWHAAGSVAPPGQH